MPALVAIAPLVKLPHARLEHLVGVKTGILSEQRVRESRNQRFGWLTEDEMAGNKASRSPDLLLAVIGCRGRAARISSAATGRSPAPSRVPWCIPQVRSTHPADCLVSSHFRDSRTRGFREQGRSCLT
jgi:hypothetical protein